LNCPALKHKRVQTSINVKEGIGSVYLSRYLDRI